MENQINHWVNNLLGVYQFSKAGNSDNRGLDTVFAKETYIPTKLDSELLPDIVKGKFKAIFLTGNAGDGKTAFLEKVFIALIERGGEEVDKTAAGWIVRYNNRVFKACYDASESEKGGKITANDRLLKIYEHLRGEEEPRTNIIVLTAINDGKLHAFFHEYQKDFWWLSNAIFDKVFGKHKQSNNNICVVNLKERALVDLEFDGDNENSLFDLTLKIFAGGKKWEICSDCSSQKICPIYYNAKTLGFSEYSGKIRPRLKLLFTISHLRKQRHNTMRNIRSALSFIITSNLSCEDVHLMSETFNETKLYSHLFFNAIYNSQDDSLIELKEIDPGLKLLPKLDRKIYNFHKSKQFELLHKNLFPSEINLDYEKLELTSDEIINSWRRRFYFEGDYGKILESFDEVEIFYDLIPYSYLKKYLKNLRKEGNIHLLREDLSRGIAQLEGIRDTELAKNNIMIKITQNSKEGLTACKKFPIEEFEVFTPKNEKLYLETMPNQLFLKHKETGIQTKINLDIYEIIKRLAEGQLPSSEEQKPVLDELTDFKSRLHRIQSDDILLIESNGLYHHITKVEGEIQRLQMNGVR